MNTLNKIGKEEDDIIMENKSDCLITKKHRVLVLFGLKSNEPTYKDFLIIMSCCKGVNSHIFPTLFATEGLR